MFASFAGIHRALRWNFFDHSGLVLAAAQEHIRHGLAAARALAALAIDDCFDFRDTFVALGEVYVRAYRLGMDIDGELDFTASMSSRMPRTGLDGGMKKFVEQFKTSAFFQTGSCAEIGK